jgi:cyclopropane-fatty-acyl-phospholipid synthase
VLVFDLDSDSNVDLVSVDSALDLVSVLYLHPDYFCFGFGYSFGLVLVSVSIFSIHIVGKLFVHIFSHAKFAYSFIPISASDWMSRYFFTNGTMPSDDLLLHFQVSIAEFFDLEPDIQGHLKLSKHWLVDGRNYGKTSELW